ncbi:MAG TPA: cytochrome b/b6 domain-containing protein [Puia sp.]|uniref:cytochrome b/b6 domain-containing protein n=1 Tax=Puia sp. TaxID=2045100 RepID=UPI002D011EB2|nr:cytochrome b/b6 domain-containing protein [Puia sp.]HVU96040.1 cytochrome b/b6 domain-containing protein [Puia sp.]
MPPLPTDAIRPAPAGHRPWVKTTHWVGTISFLLLVFSGVEILMVHPRLYWGQVGNDLTPALFELPISRNYHHGGWTASQPFFDPARSPVSAGRTYDIFNQNGWGRSLHFLNAWVFVVTGLIYLLTALYTQHVRRNLLPGRREMSFRSVARDFADHVRRRVVFVKGPQYGVLQKLSYCVVLFFLIPVTVLTGLTMSPAVTASNPWLLTLFFGAQSARTLHFFCAVLLILFFVVHVIMIVRSGFRRHLRAMTIES